MPRRVVIIASNRYIVTPLGIHGQRPEVLVESATKLKCKINTAVYLFVQCKPRSVFFSGC